MSEVDDPARLAALQDSEILSDHGVPGIDRLLRIARHALDTPTVMFSAIDHDRQVFVGQIGLPESWAEAGQTPLSHSYCQLVVTEDEPLVVTDAVDDARVCDNPATVEASIGAYLGVPVRSPDGHALGSFCAISRSARAWTTQDIDTLTDLAASVEVEIALRRTTDELSEQLAAEQLEHSFEASMASIAAATSRSWTSTDVLKALVKHGEDATRAALISVAVLEDGELHYFHGQGVAEDVARNWVVGSVDDPVPMAHAIKTGETVVLPSAESFTRWPMFVEAVADLGIRSFIAIPIGDTIGRSRAVVALGWAEPIPTLAIPKSVRRLETLLRQGLDRAHSHQTARDHAELLESLVLPDELPNSENLELAGLYRPPTAGQRVGGDLYEAIRRSDGRVALIVADAAGHDLAASRATSRLRTALNMLTLERLRPGQILDYVNTYLINSNVATLITCVYVLVDTEKDEAIIANAGHPQPRLAQANGSVTPIGPTGQQLLGFGPVEYTEERVRFERGDTMTLFTDGLIERRSDPLAVGEAWLERELGKHISVDVNALAAHLVSQIEVLRDDVALLVARHTGSAQTGAKRLDHAMPADQLHLATIRSDLRAWLGGHERTADILLVATELLANARAASAPVDSMVAFTARVANGRVELIVTNRGEPFQLGRTVMPTADTLGGRGLAVSTSLSDVEVTTEPPRVTVTARF